jgi:fatty acid desaturase
MDTTSVTGTQTDSKLFAYSRRDVLPVLAALAHAGFLVFMFFSFEHLSWLARTLMGLLYAVAISWNINSVSHNFIDNPYFRSERLNRLFSLLESVTIGFSQTFYNCVHMRHHAGNSDRQDDDGQTKDWLSIYRYGKNGLPQDVWAYTFLSYFRDDAQETYREMLKKN